ncbi:MAG: hypothetical protein AAB581_01760 [Patescibacteria group bacterium]
MKHTTLAAMAFFVAAAGISVGYAFAEDTDITPPVISSITATSTQTTATIGFATDELAYGQVEYGTTTAYGLVTAWEAASSTAHTIALASLTASTTYHFMVAAKDEAGNTATSSDQAFITLPVPPAPDTTAPVISNVSATSTQTTATITWNTNESSVGRVSYGTSTVYGITTAWESVAGTAHAAGLTSLASSTVYHFAVAARDVAGNTATSSDYVFSTLAPTVSPPPATSTADVVVKLKVEPRSINAKSKGKWVQIRVAFPEGYDARDVHTSSIKLNGTLSPERVKVKSKRTKWFDFESGRETSLQLKFSRSAVVNFLAVSASAASATTSTGTSTVPLLTKNITISGTIGTKLFSGSAAVRYIGTGDLPNGTVCRGDGSSEVYIISNGKRRHIPTARAFEELGYRWNQISILPQSVVDAYMDDMLIKASNGASVYLVSGGKKRHVTDPAEFEALGLDWEDITTLSANELGYFATVTNITLIRASGDEKVYFVSGSERRWIPSVNVFQKRGYKWEDIVIVDESELENYRVGTQVD